MCASLLYLIIVVRPRRMLGGSTAAAAGGRLAIGCTSGERLSRVQPLLCGFPRVIPRMPKVARPFTDNTPKFSKVFERFVQSIAITYKSFIAALNVSSEKSPSRDLIFKVNFLYTCFYIINLVKLPLY